jgi:Terpene cyclase DEP1
VQTPLWAFATTLARWWVPLRFSATAPQLWSSPCNRTRQQTNGTLYHPEPCSTWASQCVIEYKQRGKSCAGYIYRLLSLVRRYRTRSSFHGSPSTAQTSGYFLPSCFSTRAGAFFGLDVLVSAVVLITFIRREDRRRKMPLAWLPIAATCLIGVSCGLPLFLYLRERQLATTDT